MEGNALSKNRCDGKGQKFCGNYGESDFVQSKNGWQCEHCNNLKKLLIAEGVQTLQGFAMKCCGGQLQNTGKYSKREEFSIELYARFLPIVLIQAGG